MSLKKPICSAYPLFSPALPQVVRDLAAILPSLLAELPRCDDRRPLSVAVLHYLPLLHGVFLLGIRVPSEAHEASTGSRLRDRVAETHGRLEL